MTRLKPVLSSLLAYNSSRSLYRTDYEPKKPREREGYLLAVLIKISEQISPHFSTFYISQYLNSTRAWSEVKKGSFYREPVFNLYQTILTRRKLFYVKYFDLIFRRIVPFVCQSIVTLFINLDTMRFSYLVLSFKHLVPNINPLYDNTLSRPKWQSSARWNELHVKSWNTNRV